jgi:hypothetical protein
MIDVALRLLEYEVTEYINAQPNNPSGAGVRLFNISNLADNSAGNDANTTDKLLISLVNIEEESAFKNQTHATKLSNGLVRYANPPVYLNLYVLFACNFDQQYENALRYLSHCIRFFQGKRVFNLANSPGFAPPAEAYPDVLDLQLVLDLYTMTFEQINHLWGSLGGRQLPFVMYKVRLVQITDRRTAGLGPVIEEIGVDGVAPPPQP